MSTETDKLKKEIALLEVNAEKPEIKGNTELAKSARFKIGVLKSQLKSAEAKEAKSGSKVEAGAEKKEKAPKEPKAQKEPKVAPKVKETKEGLVVNGFKAGDKVSFVERGTEKVIKGVIESIKVSSDGDDIFNAFVRIGDAVRKCRLNKLTKA